MNDHLYHERYILAHEGYKAAIWGRKAPPACFADSDDAIVIEHNRALGSAFAAFQVDLNLQHEEIVRMGKAAVIREGKMRVLELKCKQLQNKVRELSEQIKQEEK